MFVRSLPRAFSLALVVALASLVGCGKSSTVTGTVTVNGTPLDKGQITFQPTEKGKRPEGAPVSGGKYSVKGLMAGKYTVNVTATPDVAGSSSMDDAKNPPKPVADPLPPGTKGNNATVDVNGSNQTIDVTLTTPGK